MSLMAGLLTAELPSGERDESRVTLGMRPSALRSSMAAWLSVFRVVAVMLLITAAVDLFAVDMLGFASNESSQSQTGPCNDNGVQDDCFCCCSHVVVGVPITLAATDTVSFAEPAGQPAPPASEIARIY